MEASKLAELAKSSTAYAAELQLLQHSFDDAERLLQRNCTGSISKANLPILESIAKARLDIKQSMKESGISEIPLVSKDNKSIDLYLSSKVQNMEKLVKDFEARLQILEKRGISSPHNAMPANTCESSGNHGNIANGTIM